MKKVIVAPSGQKKEFVFRRAGDVVRSGFFAFGKNLLRKPPLLTTAPSFHTRFACVNRPFGTDGGGSRPLLAVFAQTSLAFARLFSQTARASDVASPPDNVEALRPRKEFIFKEAPPLPCVQRWCVRFGPPRGTQPNRTSRKRKIFPESASVFFFSSSPCISSVPYKGV